MVLWVLILHFVQDDMETWVVQNEQDVSFRQVVAYNLVEGPVQSIEARVIMN